MKHIWRHAVPCLAVFLILAPLALGQGFIRGLAPDWDQPPDYPDAFDPLNGPMLGDPFWNAWCAPTCGAMLAAHWEDAKGRAGLADGFADGNQFKIPPGYTGPAWGFGPAWHDYTADGNVPGLFGPHPQRGARPVEDFGFYMDTNGTGVMGIPHPGTYYRDVAAGLNLFFAAQGTGPGQPAANLTATTWGVHPSFGGWPVMQMAAFVKNEIDANRTVIAHFRHWNLMPAGPPASPGTGKEIHESQFDIEKYNFGPYIPGGGHEEVWNNYEGEEGLGHAVLVVGYLQTPTGSVTHFIVHDNWPSTGRNVQVPVIPNLVAITLVQQAGDFYVKGLAPDWNQPLDYPDAFDPKNGPMPGDIFWNAWCVPASAAMLVGHWEDVKGRAGLADKSADGNQFKLIPGYLGPPWGLGPAWHDYTADGNKPPNFGPHPQRGTRLVEDHGFYMDTNGKGVVGFPHVGTFYRDVAPGLNQFFAAKGKKPGQPACNLRAVTWGVHPFFGGLNVTQLADKLKFEVEGNRTAIAHFRHWNLVPNGPPANPGTGDEEKEPEFDIEKYSFGSFIPGGGHGEDWNGEEGDEGLGHAVLVVGYTQDVWGNVTDLIAHDNWPSTGRNVQVPVGNQLVAITIARGIFLVKPKAMK